jgi:hypothetical protein
MKYEEEEENDDDDDEYENFPSTKCKFRKEELAALHLACYYRQGL